MAILIFSDVNPAVSVYFVLGDASAGLIRGSTYHDTSPLSQDKCCNKRDVKKCPRVSLHAPHKSQMIFISGEGGGAGSQLTKDVGKILSQLPTTVEALTGVDITKGLERYLGGGGGESKAPKATDGFEVMEGGA